MPKDTNSKAVGTFGPIQVAMLGVVVATFLWAYWPTLAVLVDAWNTIPDYSHGYFVVPVALYFAWSRRGLFPGMQRWPSLVGTAVLGASIGLRAFSASVYIDAVDGWSILLWTAGAVWMCCGWRGVVWAWPSIAFLLFMVPLPYRVERWLSLPLQQIATKLSCYVLQMLGQPALSEGNTIIINDFHMEIEQACSGLRIFVGIAALAFAYVVLVRRRWWEKLILLASTIPVAIVANMSRIVVTGLLHEWVSGEAAYKFTHDVAGWVMIPFAAALFALVLWYVGSLVREVEVVGVGAALRSEGAERHGTS